MVQVHHVQTRPWQGIHEIHVSLRCFVFFCHSVSFFGGFDDIGCVIFTQVAFGVMSSSSGALTWRAEGAPSPASGIEPRNAAKRSKTQQDAARRSKTQRQLTDRHLLLFARGWLGVGSWDLVGWPSWPRQMLRNGQPKRRTRPKLLAPFLSSARRSSVRHQLVVLVKFLSKKTRYRKTKKYAFHEHE